MSLQTIALRDLFASTTTKGQITRYFAEGLLEFFSGNTNVRLITTYDTVIAINEPFTLSDELGRNWLFIKNELLVSFIKLLM